MQNPAAVIVRKPKDLYQVAWANGGGNEHEDGALRDIRAREIARQWLDDRKHFWPAKRKLPPTREKCFVMWTHLAVLVHAFFGLPLAVGKNVRLDPIERAGIRRGFKLVPVLEVDDEPVEVCACESVHAVQVRENYFVGLRILADDFIALLASFAASYSAFSDKSPLSLASAISADAFGRITLFK